MDQRDFFNQSPLYLPSLTEETENILTETDQASLDPVTHFQWFNEGRSSLWVNDKNGWRQIFLMSRDGRTETLLTPVNKGIKE